MKKLFLVPIAALALIFASCGTATEKKVEAEEPAIEEVVIDEAEAVADTIDTVQEVAIEEAE